MRSPVSCRLSAVGVRFLGHPAPAGELQPSSRSAYRRRHRAPDPNGVVVLRMSKTRPGRAPPLPRGRWCAPDRRLSSGRHLPLFQRPVPTAPLEHPIGGGHLHEASSGVHSRSPITPTAAGCRPRGREAPRFPPVFSSPAAPGWNRAASASTPGFAPRGHPRRTPRRRRAIAHWPGYYTVDLSRPPRRLPLHSCTLTSHIVAGGLHHHPGHPQLDEPVGHPQQRRGHRGVGRHLLQSPPRPGLVGIRTHTPPRPCRHPSRRPVR